MPGLLWHRNLSAPKVRMFGLSGTCRRHLQNFLKCWSSWVLISARAGHSGWFLTSEVPLRSLLGLSPPGILCGDLDALLWREQPRRCESLESDMLARTDFWLKYLVIWIFLFIIPSLVIPKESYRGDGDCTDSAFLCYCVAASWNG